MGHPKVHTSESVQNTFVAQLIVNVVVTMGVLTSVIRVDASAPALVAAALKANL